MNLIQILPFPNVMRQIMHVKDQWGSHLGYRREIFGSM